MLGLVIITFTSSACSEHPRREDVLYVSEVPSQVRGAVGASLDPRGFISGWAGAPDKPSHVVDVHVYIDGDASQRDHYVGRVRANLAHAEAAKAMRSDGQYGFRFVVPARFRDGAEHTAYVYAINPSGNINPHIGTLRFRLRDARPFGVLGKLDGGTFIGWALDTDDTVSPLRVGFWVGSERIGVAKTDVARDDVNQTYHVGGAHGFRFALPAALRDGKLHVIQAFVEDDNGRRLARLSGAPQTFSIGDGVELSGALEVVFDQSRSACETWDIPDLPARALRDGDGNIQLYASHYVTYRMTGRDFGALDRICTNGDGSNELTPAYRSHLSSEPRDFANYEWLAATFRLPETNTVYALLHVEYEGHHYPGRCAEYETAYQDCVNSATSSAQRNACTQTFHNRCQETSIVAARSSDGGKTFSRTLVPQVVATRGLPYAPTGARFGYMEPSNILHANDGYYYIFVHTEISPGLQDWGTCLLRSADLSVERPVWHAWDGSGFTVRFDDPYRDSIADPKKQVCAPIEKNKLAKLANSLTYNSYLERYVLIGVQGDSFYYATSRDLIHWEPRRLIARVNAGGDSARFHYLYPSLIDHHTQRINFDHSGREAYLYFTRNNRTPGKGYDRDLVRLKIRFTK
ncbi:MAG: hypothetical protein KC503_05440 [Myxococcales bacterium]|nr:hypothetical protein [Myxococcales bacterium]